MGIELQAIIKKGYSSIHQQLQFKTTDNRF